jgi:hypothetical protein
MNYSIQVATKAEVRATALARRIREFNHRRRRQYGGRALHLMVKDF